MREREREKDSKERERRDSRRHQYNRHGYWSWSQRSRPSRGCTGSEARNRHRRQRETPRRRWEASPPMKAGNKPVASSRRTPRRNPASNQMEKISTGKRDDDDDQECSLFIDNLRRDTDVRGLRWLLRMDKNISRIYISRKRRPNNNLRFAFVKMSSPVHVKQAVNKVHRRIFLGLKIFARQAKYEKKFSSGGSGVSSKQERHAGKASLQIGTPVPESSLPGVGISEDGGDDKGALLQKSVAVVAGRNSNWRYKCPSAHFSEYGGLGMEVGQGVAALHSQDSGEDDGGGAADGGGGGATDGGGVGVTHRSKVEMVVGKEKAGDAQAGDAGVQQPGSGSGDEKNKFCVNCSCSLAENTPPCSKEDKTKVDNFNYVGDIKEGIVSVGGFSNALWSSVPYSASSWWYPVFGFWVGYPTQGLDQPGWWGQPQGWGLWPFYSSAGYYQDACVQQPHTDCYQGGPVQPPPPSAAQYANVGVKGDLCQGAVGSGVRAPVSIRKPNSKVSGSDPVVEDIINNERGGMEEAFQWIIDPGNDGVVGDIGNNSGPEPAMEDILNNDRGGVENYIPQDQMMEDDLDDIGLSSLFADPEYPPGFEPARGPSILEDNPEEATVIEEARQTLIFAKQLGCIVPDEKLTLSNYEGIIRRQRSSLCRRSHDASEESKEESDRCSRGTSKGKGKRGRGDRPLGFSKFSRASKVVMRGKKKA